jgi:hypothetical protein
MKWQFCFLSILCNFRFLTAVPLSPEEDILLIINYNHPHYSSTQFLKELYAPAFSHIVFYGDGGNIIESNGYEVKEVPAGRDVSHGVYGGYFLTRILADVLQRYPNYRGYLVLQDDYLLQYWNLAGLDREKIWFGIHCNNSPSVFYSKADLKSGRLPEYPWPWSWPHSLEPTNTALGKISRGLLDQLEQSIGVGKVVGQMCDMFYLPGKYWKEALELSIAFQDVFYEIAVPTSFCALAPRNEWEKLKMIWGVAEANHAFSHPDMYADVHWIHPVKFSNPANRIQAQKIFQQHQ